MGINFLSSIFQMNINHFSNACIIRITLSSTDIHTKLTLLWIIWIQTRSKVDIISTYHVLFKFQSINYLPFIISFTYILCLMFLFFFVLSFIIYLSFFLLFGFCTVVFSFFFFLEPLCDRFTIFSFFHIAFVAFHMQIVNWNDENYICLL